MASGAIHDLYYCNAMQGYPMREHLPCKGAGEYYVQDTNNNCLQHRYTCSFTTLFRLISRYKLLGHKLQITYRTNSEPTEVDVTFEFATVSKTLAMM